MDNFRNAAKAFIVKDGQLLLLKRRANDVHKPGTWDIPGGRLEPEESPFEGLKREAREEIDAQIKIVMPLDVNYFTRDDGQKITLMVFLCKLLDQEIKLSIEHTEYKWVDLKNQESELPQWLHGAVDHYLLLGHE